MCRCFATATQQVIVETIIVDTTFISLFHFDEKDSWYAVVHPSSAVGRFEQAKRLCVLLYITPKPMEHTEYGT